MARLIACGMCLVGVMTTVSKAAAEPPRVEAEARIQVRLEPQQAALVRQLPSANDGPGATALQKEGYDWMCGGSCELVLPPGRHTFALTTDAASVVSPSELDVPAGRSQLQARYEQRSKALGWVLVGTSPVTWYASLMIMKSLNGGSAVSGGQTVLGSGIAIAQLVIGIVLISRPGGSATFTLTPLAAASARSRFGVEQQLVARDLLHGSGLQIAF